ncbi:hypothetical protein [Streptomyces sp. NPDC086782]|uniref:hypothetical protein n=1 Tax=Streptomyces sp. NPDC086782 TaxID=3365757 RepID=UPI003828D0C6
MPAVETRAQKWERVARLLKKEPISNMAAARQLRVDKAFVREVREGLGMSPYRLSRDQQNWERVARLLKKEPISNIAVARQLRVDKAFVRQVREDLGMRPFWLHRDQWTVVDFEALSVPVGGGHRLWRGRFSTTNVPMAGRSETAYRLAFRLLHGREPVGRCEGTCTRKACVAGEHQEDDVMRAAEPGRLSYQGMDLVAIRKALRGTPPYPRLRPEEKRMAFRLADPSLGVVAAAVPVIQLARRLGCCDQTIRRWRDEGVPA